MSENNSMTSAEATATRHLIGLTFEQVGEALDINPRSVRRWESGASLPGAGAAGALRALRAEHDKDTKRLCAKAAKASPLLIPTGKGDTRPAGWWKAVAARVLDRSPGTVIEWH
ncbi:hypothetical protein ACTXM3_08080 [Glutamicibacter arilaitensis]|uniref:hypothetical protein n=1 Tax=Glutamicibacter arilaitensis TaxID=256701 RepID=UPI003FCF9285